MYDAFQQDQVHSGTISIDPTSNPSPTFTYRALVSDCICMHAIHAIYIRSISDKKLALFSFFRFHIGQQSPDQLHIISYSDTAYASVDVASASGGDFSH